MGITIPPGGYRPPLPPYGSENSTRSSYADNYNLAVHPDLAGSNHGGDTSLGGTPSAFAHQLYPPPNQIWHYYPYNAQPAHLCEPLPIFTEQHTPPPGVTLPFSSREGYPNPHSCNLAVQCSDPSRKTKAPRRKTREMQYANPVNEKIVIPQSPSKNNAGKRLAEGLILKRNLDTFGITLPALETPEQIKAWVLERKKRYPTCKKTPLSSFSSPVAIEKKTAAHSDRKRSQRNSKSISRSRTSKLHVGLKSMSNGELLSRLVKPDILIERMKALQCINHLIKRRII